MDLTQKRWTTELVRVCEIYPDRIGANGIRVDKDGSRCIAGEISFRMTGDAWLWPNDMPGEDGYPDLSHPMFQAVRLNNEGIPWGQIPKLVGLVPGEAPAEMPEALVPEEVTA
jgi:hypothetical protein